MKWKFWSEMYSPSWYWEGLVSGTVINRKKKFEILQVSGIRTSTGKNNLEKKFSKYWNLEMLKYGAFLKKNRNVKFKTTLTQHWSRPYYVEAGVGFGALSY